MVDQVRIDGAASTMSLLISNNVTLTAQTSVSVLTGWMGFVASSGLVLLVPFFLQDLQGRPPAAAGLLIVSIRG